MLSRKEIYHHFNLFVYNHFAGKNINQNVPDYMDLPLEKITDMKDVLDHIIMNNGKKWHINDITLDDPDFYQVLSNMIDIYYSENDTSLFWSHDHKKVMQQIIEQTLEAYDNRKVDVSGGYDPGAHN